MAWWAVLILALLTLGALWLGLVPGGFEGENPYRRIFRRILDGRSASQRIDRVAILTSFMVVGASLCISLGLGIMVGSLQVVRNRVCRFLGAFYVEAVRGIPVYVMLLFVYFGVRNLVGDYVTLTPFFCAVAALGVAYGAYMSEVVRAGIMSIPSEEIEAASLEGTPVQVFGYIILPQALRTILPALANESIALLKDSALVGLITVVEITRAAEIHAGSTFQYLETYAVLAMIYLVLSLILSRFQRTLERLYGGARAFKEA
ncbi:MAG: amino acid ABC transporter permease [Candidatus Sumerlaeia bacterium]|nr:amino acid ABC transporter permease [Candidatus Sumerlaeia bacterium]